MAEVTYYFNEYMTGVWTNPNNMVDGNLATFGSTSTKNATQILTGNDCPGTDLGVIQKVELRAYGYGDGDDQITLNGIGLTMPSSPGWSGYVDVGITTWEGVVALDATVQFTVVGKANTMYCAIVQIRVTYTEPWVPPESDIDVGADPIDRAYTIFRLYTYIDKNNPANASGTLHSVKVYANTDITGLRVGTFYVVSGNTLKCRDSVVIGNVTAGSEQTFTGLSITVVEGDYIGCYFTTGLLETDAFGYLGYWYVSGEYVDPGDEATYDFASGIAISLYGYGDILVEGWKGKISGVTNPAKIMGVDVANIVKVKGVV